MYAKITGEDPYQDVPMRIYPAVHYTMGGLWVDYNLHVEHPRAVRRSAKRTSATTGPTASVLRALMQGLADGYFVLPYTIGDYLAASRRPASFDANSTRAFAEAEDDVARARTSA